MNLGRGSGNAPWSRQSGLGSLSSSSNSFAHGFGQQQGLARPGLVLPSALTSSTSPFNLQRTSATVNQSSAINQPKQRVFAGTITKISENFGFVDEDVFFQTSCCTGGVPKIGDRVLVEATFNPNMPFKWNATRLQLMPNPQLGPSASAQQHIMQQVNVVHTLSAIHQAQATSNSINSLLNSGMNLQRQIHQQASYSHQKIQQAPKHFPAVPPVTKVSQIQRPVTAPTSSASSTNNARPSRFNQRDKHDENRDKRSPAPRRESRSPKNISKSRSKSPKRKQKTAPRYSVCIQQLSFDTKECTIMNIKARYHNMYIPSDFSHLLLNWTEVFPLQRPLKLGNPTKFHILNKEADAPDAAGDMLDPYDADYSYSAKVMLLTQPSIDTIYRDCCSLAEDLNDEEFLHPARLIQFLVGIKVKNEPMAIGGPWSPSLDGPDPENDPRVLIKTAIRTTRALTGIDLSNCMQWYRFVEISYWREDEVHKGKTIPAHTEKVVIFLPDVWSIVPSMTEYSVLKEKYSQLVLKKLKPVEEKEEVTASEETGDLKSNNDEDLEADQTTAENPEKSHWSKLDPKVMKVTDLRAELDARNINSTGLKTQLQAKLSKALKAEMEAEEEKDQEKTDKMEQCVQSEAEKSGSLLCKEDAEKEEKELECKRVHLEKLHSLPEDPVIPVHPSRTAKSGKFDCTVMNLSLLLDYRPEDNKEHVFEVSVFAESFNEMLMRDFGFTIYKTLMALPGRQEKEESSSSKKAIDSQSNSDPENDGSSTSKLDETGIEQKQTIRETSSQPEAKRRRFDSEVNNDDDNTRSSIDLTKTVRKRGEDRRRWITVNKAALLAFVYYDTTHTGFIVDKDLEEMIHTLGLQLTRAQVHKLVRKVCEGKETLYYRKFTDKPEGRSEDIIQKPDIASLAIGNRIKLKSDNQQFLDTETVLRHGSVFKVDKLMSKLDKSEQARLIVEQQVKLYLEEMSVLSKKAENDEEKIKRLNSDVKNLTEKIENLKGNKRKSEHEIKNCRDVLHNSSRDLHKVLRLIDESIKLSDEKVRAEKHVQAADTNRKDSNREVFDDDNNEQTGRDRSDISLAADKTSDNSI